MGSDLPVVSGRCTHLIVTMGVGGWVSVMVVIAVGMGLGIVVVVGLGMKELHLSTPHLILGYKGIVTSPPPRPPSWVEQEDPLLEDCPSLQLAFLTGAG